LRAKMAAVRTLHIIGYGAVGQAMHALLKIVIKEGKLPEFTGGVHFWAPEIKAESVEGSLSFSPIPFVTRETLGPILDGMKLAPGDVVLEAATRIDTQTIWKDVKARGAHFLNSGFDVWPDVTLDLAGLDELQADPAFSKGAGKTCIFSFGCNPGIASHFVRHALTAATGIEDAREAAKAFGLASISFFERDTQWPAPGTKGEALFKSTQCDVLYNTWSPGNYIVETAESTILYAGCPEAAKTVCSAGPAVMGWVPSGPNIGFMAPHDETFTIQGWFDKLIPAVFVYEAPPAARAYLKGGRAEHSSVAKKELMCPAKHDLAGPGYDMLGCLLFPEDETKAPFWCGITQTVSGSAAIDPTGGVGPTPFQVVGGVWSALQYVLRFPDAGDNFPEGLPTPFIMANAFPWAGELVARPAPEARAVTNLFNPGKVDKCAAEIAVGEPAPGRAVPAPGSAGGASVAGVDLPATAALVQLTYDAPVLAAAAAAFAHAPAPEANCFVDRNRAVRTLRSVPAGGALTLDHRLLDAATVASVHPEALRYLLESVPLIHDDAVRAALGMPA